MRLFLVIFAVEALAASWIEIRAMSQSRITTLSKPLRLRGLKCPMFLDVGIDELVEALAASWIEIICDTSANKIYHVEALAASWIEIQEPKYYH